MARKGQNRATLSAVVLLALLLYLSNISQAQGGAGWLDSAWTYRNPVTLNNGGTSLSNFQVHVVLAAHGESGLLILPRGE